MNAEMAQMAVMMKYKMISFKHREALLMPLMELMVALICRT